MNVLAASIGIIGSLLAIAVGFILKNMFDELEDSFDGKVFFGPVSDIELKIAKKLSNRKTELFNINKKKLSLNEVDQAMISQNIGLLPSEADSYKDVLESDINAIDDAIQESYMNSHNYCTPNIEEMSQKIMVPLINDSKEAVPNNEASENIDISLNTLTEQNLISYNINNRKSSIQTSLPEDLCDLVISSFDDPLANEMLSQSEKLPLAKSSHSDLIKEESNMRSHSHCNINMSISDIYINKDCASLLEKSDLKSPSDCKKNNSMTDISSMSEDKLKNSQENMINSFMDDKNCKSSEKSPSDCSKDNIITDISSNLEDELQSREEVIIDRLMDDKNCQSSEKSPSTCSEDNILTDIQFYLKDELQSREELIINPLMDHKNCKSSEKSPSDCSKDIITNISSNLDDELHIREEVLTDSLMDDKNCQSSEKSPSDCNKDNIITDISCNLEDVLLSMEKVVIDPLMGDKNFQSYLKSPSDHCKDNIITAISCNLEDELQSREEVIIDPLMDDKNFQSSERSDHKSPSDFNKDCSMADISSNSFEYMEGKSCTQLRPVNTSPNARMSLSFSKDEKYYEENIKKHFNIYRNQFKLDCQKNTPTIKIEEATPNYFDTLDLIDISSACDDISESDNSYYEQEVLENNDLPLHGTNTDASSGSYVSDGSKNYAVLMSNSEEIQQQSLQSEYKAVNLETERVFNDTIEEIELLMKYGEKYFQEEKKLSNDSKMILNDDSILSPRKQSVSSIHSDAFIPPYNSTHHSDDSYNSITNKGTFIVETPKKAQIRSLAPPKPPRKGKSPEVVYQSESYVKSSIKKCTPIKKKGIPTYTMKPKVKSPKTPYNTPCLKKTSYITPSNKTIKMKPASAINLFKIKPKTMPPTFLTPQPRHTNYKPLKIQKSPMTSESENLHKKMRTLSIVSPVAQYLQNNPPPPLITTVKPRNKINPKTIEKELSPTGTTVLKDSNKTPVGKQTYKYTKKVLLPAHSYASSKTQILEKENINTRREILTNNPPTSITKHIGRFEIPKDNKINVNTSITSKDQSMMEVSVCETRSVQHSHTLH